MVTAEALSALPGPLVGDVEAEPCEAAHPRAWAAANVCSPHGHGTSPATEAVEEGPARLLRVVTSSEYTWRGPVRTLAGLAHDILGLSPRKARVLLRLERVGDACPELRSAWRDGALSWLQAQILVPLLAVDADGDWRSRWIRFAQRVTLRRLEEVVEEALLVREADPARWERCREAPGRASAGRSDRWQVCARPTAAVEGITLRVTAPREVARLFRAVLCSWRRALEARTGRLPSEAEAFEAMLDCAPHTICAGCTPGSCASAVARRTACSSSCPWAVTARATSAWPDPFATRRTRGRSGSPAGGG
jgi:hypothetical protein